MNKLKEMIQSSSHIVFFGGAGVSTGSGIKDFRSKDGLYHMNYKKNIEYMLSLDCFLNETEEFYKFYKTYMNLFDYKPNNAHLYLKKLEDEKKLDAIITQNIDGLHQKAGSKNVFELHGTIYENYCMKCHLKKTIDDVFKSNGIPTCECGGIIKSNVILYGESLDEVTLYKSIHAIENADMLIVAGTSLKVEPAASLIRYFKGKYLVIINKEETSYDKYANLVLKEKVEDVFSKLM